jgi:hypothetical protein
MGGNMYKIEKRPSGFLLTFGGFIQKEEMTNWYNDSVIALEGKMSEFGVIIDMKTLKPIPQDAKDIMVKGQGLYKEKGMIRSAVILANAITTAQFKHIAKESGIYSFERYIDASINSDPLRTAIDWVKNEIDPDA